MLHGALDGRRRKNKKLRKQKIQQKPARPRLWNFLATSEVGSVPTSPLILLQKYRDTNGRRIVIQIGGVYATACQREGILLQKYRDRNGRCIAILFKSIGVRGRFDAPDEEQRKKKQRRTAKSCRQFPAHTIVKACAIKFPLIFGPLLHFYSSMLRGQKRHINIWHINNVSVTPVTGPPGRVPRRKCLCSLGSAHST